MNSLADALFDQAAAMNRVAAKAYAVPQPSLLWAWAVCGLCNGTGLYCYTMNEQEVQEACRGCNGKKTIIVESEK
jgi:hypothetical protein